jgi:hypothetical protein
MRTSDYAHHSIDEIMQWFEARQLPEHLRVVSEKVGTLAHEMATELGGAGPEVTAGLRKLLEAKDCFVRAAIVAKRLEDIDGAA